MTFRRRWVAGVAVAVAVLLVAGIWAVAVAFKSPAQRDAAARPPAAAPVLATVKRGDLSRTVRSTATVVRAHRQTLRIGADAGAAVTQSARSPGAELGAGAVVLEVNGRPRFATRGAFPYYRDLVEGSRGPDVRQLQEALGVSADGEFGPGTAAAIVALYRSAGYEPPVQDLPEEPASGETSAGEARSSGASSSQESASRETRSGAEPSADGGSSSAAGPNASATTTAPAPAPATLVIPRAELLVLHELPAYVIAVPAVGELDADAVIDVESGGLVARAALPEQVSAELADAMPVTISHERTERKARVADVQPRRPDTAGERGVSERDSDDAEAATGSATGETQTDFVAADGATLDTGWIGREVTVSIVLAVAAEDALLVPSVAVVTGRGDTEAVRKRQRDGTFRMVPVVEQATLDGRSAVVAVEPGELRPGDQVRVD